MSDSNNRIAKNTLFLYARMILVLFVGLYTSRVVLNVLGASDYGVNNVIAGFVSLFAFLNATFSSSIQRFYNYEGSSKGEVGYTSVFSVGIRVHAILALTVFVLLESFGIWYINNIMVLPEGRITAANILYQFSIISLLLLIIQIPFLGIIIAKERMDFYAIVSILDVILKLLLIILLPYFPFDKLIVFASIQLFVNIVNFVLYVTYAKTKFKFIRIESTIDSSLLKRMLSFSGWTLVGSFAFLFKGQGVNLLLNSFFGTIVNAARGVAYQVNSAIMGFSSNLSMAFRPQIVSSYAEGNIKRTFDLFLSQSKLCYCLTLMLITPVILEVDYLLHIWLGDAVPEHTNIFTALVLIDAMVNTLNSPVTQVVFATGKIKGYQIWSALVNLLLLPVCWLFLKMGFEAWIVFLLTIIISILCQIACLMVMHKVFHYSYRYYLIHIIFPCLLMTGIVPIIPYIISSSLNPSFARLLLVSIASLVMTMIILYCFFLNQSEKNLIKQHVSKIGKRVGLAKKSARNN